MAASENPKYPPDRFIQVGSLRARYWADGEQGSPVVLVHGLGGYAETWWPNNLALARQHRVFVVDLPGFGRSDKPASAPYDYPYFATFIHDFMAALGIEKAALAGHSMGGGVALQFALAYPAQVERLVLVSSAGLGKEVSLMLRLASLPLLGELATRPGLQASRDFMKEILYDPALITEQDVQLDFAMASQAGAQQAFLKALRALGTVFGQKEKFTGPILDSLPSLPQLTLVFWGRQDKIVPVSQAEAARRIPNVRLEIFERCGHIPQFEHPEPFDRALQEFLSA